MSTSQIQSWFAHTCSQLSDMADGCLYLNNQSTESCELIRSTSDEFAQSERVLNNVKAVISRRKAVVTQVVSDESEQSAVSSTNTKTKTVTDIAAKNYLVAAPLIINKQNIGVVCFEFKYERGSRTQDYLSQVESAITWLACLLQLSEGTNSVHAEIALRIAAIALSQSESSEAAMAVMAELANRLHCDRVSIGYVEHHDVHIHAISNSTHHEARQNIVKHIETVMLEAIDQKETLVFPPEAKSYYQTQEHDRLIRRYGGEYICTVPLVVQDDVIGAITFERSGEAGAFDRATRALCETLGSLIAPILQYRRLNDRPISEKIRESVRGFFSGLLGTGHLGAKFIAALLCIAFVFAFILQWDYRVSANALLEGTIERVITSPEDGFIRQASARPGDIVEAGAALATLDDRDLQLEKLKWSGKHKQVSKEYREALALHDLSQIGILRAQLAQAEAQLEILEQKLSRTKITAPISGVIVSGDYTRALGSPVERGQILYKVSPLDDFRVVLKVNEKDVSDIKVGMRGELSLTAAAEETYEIETVKITPVATAENGSNFYRVEAKLIQKPDFLRPGMQGVGKVDIGERQLLWIWTHEMTEWIRLKLWSWW